MTDTLTMAADDVMAADALLDAAAEFDPETIESATPARLTREFVLAGKAIFTVELPPEAVTGDRRPHYTFRVDRVPASGQWKESYFAKLLTGSENDSDESYSYVGKLDDFTGQVRLTAKSCVSAKAYSFHLLNRILARIWGGDHEAFEQFGYVVRHAGRCGRCSRLLTTPTSLARGLGADCAEKMGL